MVLFTKDLLINLLFIIIMCFIANIAIGHFDDNVKVRRIVHMTIGGIAILGCIAFGVQVNQDVIFDLRQIPFILVGLMEGSVVTLSLLFITVTARLLFGGDGIIATIIVYGLLAVFILKLGPRYLKGRLLQRFIITLFLSITCSVIMILSLKFLGQSMWYSLWLIYLTIPAVGMIIMLLISEGIQRYYLLRKEIIKAEKIHTISNLAAAFGHEVRNPICVSKGFLQLLLEENLSFEKRLEYAKTALHELNCAEKVIQDYLTFAKPQQEKIEHLNLYEEIKQVLAILVPMANMNNVLINLKEPKSPKNKYLISGDKNHLHQCLLNILKNAIEAMYDGGTLQVEIYLKEKTVGISIADTGIGMTKEQLKRLGEPYYSLKEKGTGLGMMVVFSIVKSMGGKIMVDSDLGKGTTFILKFPKHILTENSEIDSNISYI